MSKWVKKWRSMAARVLFRHGLRPRNNSDKPIFFKHSICLGTIMAIPDGDRAVISIPEINFCRVMKASMIERFLKMLEARGLL